MFKPISNKKTSSCTFKTFWVGFTDWWLERCHPELADKSKDADKSTTNKVIQAVALGGLLIAAPVLAAAFAPLAAGTMSAVGTQAVAFVAQLGAIVIGLGFLLGIPAWVGWRTSKFCRAMCERGQDIQAGRRKKLRLL